MAWVYTYRVCTFVLAIILAIIAFILSVQTTAVAKKDSDFDVSKFHYANVGIAAGVMTLVTIPLMLLREYLQGAERGSSILFELLWLTLLWILWIVAGSLSFSEANFSFLSSCDELAGLKLSGLVTICKDSQPLGISSIITGVILLLYTLTLLVVALSRSGRGQPVWGESVKESEKAV